MSHTHMWAWLRVCIVLNILLLLPPPIMQDYYCAAKNHRVTGEKHPDLGLSHRSIIKVKKEGGGE